jgi:hypothetical protein
MDVNSFMDRVPPTRRARVNAELRKHKEDIMTLHRRGYSLGRIMEYLASNGVHATRTSIHLFIKDNEQSKQGDAQ